MAALLAALERHREVRGSLPLYDGLLRDDPAGVAAALAASPRHPLRGEIEAWLRTRGVPAPPEDPVADSLRTRAEAAERRTRELERLLDEALGARATATRTADAVAAVAVLLALVAVAGWLAAFGVLPFTPERSAPPPEPPKESP